MATQTFTREQVSKNNNADSLHVIIDSKVYDLTDFADAHPGGVHVLLQVAGQDATSEFYSMHRHEILTKYSSMVTGTIQGETPQVIEPKAGDLCLIPYTEPMWLSPEFKSPYYDESHRRLQKEVRVFVDEFVRPEALRIEEAGERPSAEIIKRMADNGINAMRLGPGKHLDGYNLIGGIEPKKFNYFHELVLNQELVRTHGRACNDGFLGGMVIGLPPVLNFSRNAALRDRVMRECFSGEKSICLAVSEAFAGSDVAAIRTTAAKSADGTHYIVNGTKKWITNGSWADYFTTAVKTDKGYSVLLVERGEGVETEQIKTSYSSAAGTAFITFDNVKVPVENLLGKEHQGFPVIMSNFNHERWVMACASIRASRVVVEECLKWANQRKVFGKRLVDQPVIRGKLAKMISLVESGQSWLEAITYQMCNMTYQQQAKSLAGPIALLKNFITRAAHEIADESVQVFGGRGITKSGMGRVIENFHRTYKFDAVLGGSEEILGDLAVRQAFKNFPKSML
ncbi:acyl-CoA dehydrogenase NM domain-like protein [Choiromyces venosus 120613-1]|uniref:Acyl-CoA dehydrogenase NM domain-like protein n=1 Tax=Choiromyces venosus 120613-1 TaxID=1336337 RepID=A0A3N4JT84_9PEZI|nr:acyl-CoA dehydrogenase NM domain-like protein [Choiromyces venosus 120613-1]